MVESTMLRLCLVALLWHAMTALTHPLGQDLLRSDPHAQGQLESPAIVVQSYTRDGRGTAQSRGMVKPETTRSIEKRADDWVDPAQHIHDKVLREFDITRRSKFRQCLEEKVSRLRPASETEFFYLYHLCLDFVR